MARPGPAVGHDQTPAASGSGHRVAQGLVALVALYQALISPWLPRACRFTPTCSQYAREALLRYGAWKGGWLALRRLGRCHPFHAGGHDPLV